MVVFLKVGSMLLVVVVLLFWSYPSLLLRVSTAYSSICNTVNRCRAGKGITQVRFPSWGVHGRGNHSLHRTGAVMLCCFVRLGGRFSARRRVANGGDNRVVLSSSWHSETAELFL
ncbi:hypothetical protein K469DRAFT_1443 [Zopfia rhizophila CBS 207.26]|uniref:Uncharacterized protein n=1 Tax=Zopfia rhizophila CBS 207.26 TaxID=1314779 RepID=A0A6A6EVF3_9PEZI|nr:hypothetical protein K469DRAFT_1443 [Zopfia rhizophila CBS 207.26]